MHTKICVILHKNQLQIDQRSQTGIQILKRLEEKRSKYLQDIGAGEDFKVGLLLAQLFNSPTIDKLNLMKLKNFCTNRETSTECEK